MSEIDIEYTFGFIETPYMTAQGIPPIRVVVKMEWVVVDFEWVQSDEICCARPKWLAFKHIVTQIGAISRCNGLQQTQNTTKFVMECERK